jgi:hypothetical protein
MHYAITLLVLYVGQAAAVNPVSISSSQTRVRELSTKAHHPCIFYSLTLFGSIGSVYLSKTSSPVTITSCTKLLIKAFRSAREFRSSLSLSSIAQLATYLRQDKTSNKKQTLIFLTGFLRVAREISTGILLN